MLKPMYSQVTPINEEERLWKIDDVMKYLSCSEVTVWRYMHRHGLPYIKMGRTTPLLFRREAVKAWITSQEKVECNAVS